MNIPKTSKGNLVQILLVIALTLYIVVKDVTVPLLNGRQDRRPAVDIGERLARLEECTRKIESIPEKVAALTEATSNLKASVDRIEKKLDNIERGGGAPHGTK